MKTILWEITANPLTPRGKHFSIDWASPNL